MNQHTDLFFTLPDAMQQHERCVAPACRRMRYGHGLTPSLCTLHTACVLVHLVRPPSDYSAQGRENRLNFARSMDALLTPSRGRHPVTPAHDLPEWMAACLPVSAGAEPDPSFAHEFAWTHPHLLPCDNMCGAVLSVARRSAVDTDGHLCAVAVPFPPHRQSDMSFVPFEHVVGALGLSKPRRRFPDVQVALAWSGRQPLVTDTDGGPWPLVFCSPRCRHEARDGKAKN